MGSLCIPFTVHCYPFCTPLYPAPSFNWSHAPLACKVSVVSGVRVCVCGARVLHGVCVPVGGCLCVLCGSCVHVCLCVCCMVSVYVCVEAVLVCVCVCVCVCGICVCCVVHGSMCTCACAVSVLACVCTRVCMHSDSEISFQAVFPRSCVIFWLEVG